jgi:hypothetical protein
MKKDLRELVVSLISEGWTSYGLFDGVGDPAFKF